MEDAVRNPLFRKMEEISPGFYEIQLAKSRIPINLPTSLGVAVLSYAKEALLDFQNYLDRLIDRDHKQNLMIDTDCLYFSAASDNLEDLVQPHLRREYYDSIYGHCSSLPVTAGQNGVSYFPRRCCQEHELLDKSSPLFFKLENKSDSMICLNPKSVITRAVGPTTTYKYSCKGIQRDRLDMATIWDRYLSVLKTAKPEIVENITFRSFGNKVYTYAQKRVGLSHSYWKRKIGPDLINTTPLEF